MDNRDSQTWVAVELTNLGEQRAEDGTLEKLLRKDLAVDDDWPVFIPSMTYIRDGRKVQLHLMEGYAFVATGLPETHYFGLERKSHVEKVLSVVGSRGLRTLHVIPDEKIQEIRDRMREVVSETVYHGTVVRVVDGLYNGLSGKVVGEDKESVFVLIELRSISIIATIPRFCVEVGY